MRVLFFAAAGLVSLELVYVVYILRDQPRLLTFLLISIHFLLVVAYGLGKMSRVLLEDEDYRVIAAWPVSSSSYLAARLLPLVKNWLIITVIMWSPPSLIAMFLVGTPGLTGIVFFLVVLIITAGAIPTIAALHSLLISIIGPRWYRQVIFLIRLLAFALPVVVLSLAGNVPTVDSPDSSGDPILLLKGLPIIWVASIVNTTSLDVAPADLWMPVLGLVTLVGVPWLSFRLTARMYTKGLGRARAQPRRKFGRLARFFLQGLHRPADRVVAMLVFAHFRQDWRFRIQVSIVPSVILGLLLISIFRPDAGGLFSDPLVTKTMLSPVMLFVVVAVLVPILSISAMLISQEFRAAWLLRLSSIPPGVLASSLRRIFWAFFGLPFLASLAIVNALYEVPWISIGAHTLMLALIMETVAVSLQRTMAYLPFSRGNEDETVWAKLMVGFIMVHTFAGIVSMLVVHVFYRYWVAYATGALFLLLLRKSLGRSRKKKDAYLASHSSSP